MQGFEFALRFLMHGFVDFGGPGGPGMPETPSNRWAAKRPTGWKGFLARRGRLNPTKNHA